MPYNPYLFQPYQQMIQQAVQPQQQGGNFISVPNEMTARNYPIAPGNSVTFIDENSPYCYTKTMGLNQLDRPVFKRYKLVEEQDMPVAQNNSPVVAEDAVGSIDILPELKSEIRAIRALYDDLKLEVEILKESADNGKSNISKSLTAE